MHRQYPGSGECLRKEKVMSADVAGSRTCDERIQRGKLTASIKKVNRHCADCIRNRDHLLRCTQERHR